MTRPAIGIALVFTLLLSACAKPIPRYPAMSPKEAAETIRARDSAIHSLSAEGTLLLKNKDGSSVTLDAAIAAMWPGYLRVRAWKFGNPAFDLTCTPEGLWVYIPDEARQRMNSDLSVSAAQLRNVWGLIGPGFFDGSAIPQTTSSNILTLKRPLNAAEPDKGGVTIECDIDPETLTVRQFRFLDPDGKLRQSLTLTNYRLAPAEPIVWPRLISAEGDSGNITIRLREPEFNTDLPESAFIPPKRATKQP